MIRVAILADYLEEGWPSMDLVADMLLQHLLHEHAGTIAPVLVRPPMPRRLSRGSPATPGRADTLDRILARQWDYPRAASRLDRGFDVFHVIDHSYAHLVHSLPAERTIVTCHDVDAFRSVLEPHAEPRSTVYRMMVSRILSGLRAAAHVPCDSEATRDALVTLAGLPPSSLIVIPNGSAATGWAEPGAHTDFEAARLLGPRGGIELLHVGSTIPRKRIDVLLHVFAAVRARRPEARLVRVGGAFTAEQRVRARELGLLDAIAVLPFVDRATLGAVYRRATLALLPSEREGFGLPLVEALGCGTPVVASDIPALREVGGDAAEYCAVGDVPSWRDAVLRLIDERASNAEQWRLRRERSLARAADFSWSRYAAAVAEIYRTVAASGRTSS